MENHQLTQLLKSKRPGTVLSNLGFLLVTEELRTRIPVRGSLFSDFDFDETANCMLADLVLEMNTPKNPLPLVGRVRVGVAQAGEIVKNNFYTL